uniref:Uncharacterized protein n=1 Tax=Caenorhabditis japonica TaxID=281687 RepID=A0A8R1I518_CAEJA
MRPQRPGNDIKPSLMRRSGSSEDIPQTTPSRMGRPSGPPPARPAAPPPPVPTSTPSFSQLSNRFASPASSRATEDAPPPPQRTASKAPASSGLTSSRFPPVPTASIAPAPPPPASSPYPVMMSTATVSPNVPFHPLNRFHFLPLSQLPPPPNAGSRA